MTGKELRKLRAEMGLTQADLAQRLGYTEKALQALESGRVPISKSFEKHIVAEKKLWDAQKALQRVLLELDTP